MKDENEFESGMQYRSDCGKYYYTISSSPLTWIPHTVDPIQQEAEAIVEAVRTEAAWQLAGEWIAKAKEIK